jgi:hypothetical protein
MSAIDNIIPTDPTARELKSKAVAAKLDLLNGKIDYKTAVAIVEPYIEYVNNKARQIATKYGMRAGKISITGFLR